jgi:hypothetical protein
MLLIQEYKGTIGPLPLLVPDVSSMLLYRQHEPVSVALHKAEGHAPLSAQSLDKP